MLRDTGRPQVVSSRKKGAATRLRRCRDDSDGDVEGEAVTGHGGGRVGGRGQTPEASRGGYGTGGSAYDDVRVTTSSGIASTFL